MPLPRPGDLNVLPQGQGIAMAMMKPNRKDKNLPGIHASLKTGSNDKEETGITHHSSFWSSRSLFGLAPMLEALPVRSCQVASNLLPVLARRPSFSSSSAS